MDMTNPKAAAQVEKQARALLRARFAQRYIGAQIESVPWIRRYDDEFVAIVIDNDRGDVYDQVLDFLTAPGNPLTVVREHVGKYDTRIYVQLGA